MVKKEVLVVVGIIVGLFLLAVLVVAISPDFRFARKGPQLAPGEEPRPFLVEQRGGGSKAATSGCSKYCTWEGGVPGIPERRVFVYCSEQSSCGLSCQSEAYPGAFCSSVSCTCAPWAPKDGR